MKNARRPALLKTAAGGETLRPRPGGCGAAVDARRLRRPSVAAPRPRIAVAGTRAAVVRAALSRASRALAGVTGGLLLAGCGMPPAASGMAADSGRGAPARSTVAVEQTVLLDLSVEALLDRKPPPIRIERNIFRFGLSADDDPEPPRARTVASHARAASPRAAPPPAAAARTPAIRFIGIVEARDRQRRVAVLADERGIHHGHSGTVVGGRYRVVAVDVTSVQLDDLMQGTRMTLRLNESGLPQ